MRETTDGGKGDVYRSLFTAGYMGQFAVVDVTYSAARPGIPVPVLTPEIILSL